MGFMIRDRKPYGASTTPVVLISKLLQGQTTVSFTSPLIKNFESYKLEAENKPFLKCRGVSINGTTLTATYPAQSTDVNIKLIISGNLNSHQVQVFSVNGQSGAVELFNFSNSVTAETGDTSVTIEDVRIHTNSFVLPWQDCESGYPVNITRTQISEGQVVYTFNELTEDVDFCAQIFNI